MNSVYLNNIDYLLKNPDQENIDEPKEKKERKMSQKEIFYLSVKNGKNQNKKPVKKPVNKAKLKEKPKK